MQLVDRFGTGLVTTEIHRVPDGYVWTRRAGPTRPTPWASPGPDLRRAFADLPSTGMRLLLPDADADADADGDRSGSGGGDSGGGALVYRAGGPANAGKLLSSPTTVPVVTAAMAELGAALRVLHTGVDAGLVRVTPPGPARLRAWLRDGTGPAAAGALHRLFSQRLGRTRISHLLDWCADLAEHSGPTTVAVHGNPTTGLLVPGVDGHPDGLLTGEDVARGPAAFDLGWVIGEFLEFRLLHVRTLGLDADELARAADELLRGYGPVDRPAVDRVAILRFVTHAHDFAAYVAWVPELVRYADTIAGLVDAGDPVAVG